MLNTRDALIKRSPHFVEEIMVKKSKKSNELIPGYKFKAAGCYKTHAVHKEICDQVATVQYAQENGFVQYGISNEVGSSRAKYILSAQVLAGKRPGISDLLLFTPKKDGKRELIFIEMKKERETLKSGKLSTGKPSTREGQYRFLELLEEACIGGFIAQGFSEAKQILDSYI